ncbi:AAA domain-containing protein [Lacinutrix chionoecetis]
MPIKFYRVNKETTHENEYFRSLAIKLHKHHSEKEAKGLHVLIVNLSVNGHQLDAVYISHGQITVIDFKDYGGELSFSENGQWSMDSEESGTVFVSGGARMRNPFQQVRAYKFSLLEFLNLHSKDFLDDNHQIDLGHISAFVNFQKPVKYEEKDIPKNAIRWFKVTDVNTIIPSLDDRNSEKLNLTDIEIEKLVNCLGINDEMLFDPENTIDQPVNRSLDPGRLSIILKHLADTTGWEPHKKILQYYLTLVRAERYKASDLLEKVIADNISFNQANFQIQLENYPDFLSAYIEDGAQQWSKDVFVGINVLVGTSLVPLFYKVISRSGITEDYSIEINQEDTELYVPSLEKMQLAEDVLETIQSKLAVTKTLDEKLSIIREEINTVVELSSSVTLALHQEGLYSAQLMSELRKLIKVELDDSSLFKQLLLNNPIHKNNSPILPSPVLSVSPLNNSQKRAVALAFKQPIAVITGPPGTGKSQVVLNIMANALYNNIKCLFVSRNHKAVDTVNERFDDLVSSPYLLKFAGSRSIDEDVKPAITALTNRMQSIDESIDIEFQAKNKQIKELLSKNNKKKNLPQEIETLEIKVQSLEKEIILAKSKLDNLGTNVDDWDFLIKNSNRLNYRNSDLKNLKSQLESYPVDFLSNIFRKGKKRKIDIALTQFRENLPSELEKLVDDKAPLKVNGVAIQVSGMKFLNEIEKFKNKQDAYSLKLVKATNELKELESELEKERLLLNTATKSLAHLNEELHDFDTAHQELSKQVLQSLIELKISNSDGDSLISYRDFLPAKNAWQHNEIERLKVVQSGAIKSLNLVTAVSLSVRNAFTLSPEIFDMVIVDEASQCDLASLLPVIYRAKRVVILGDPNQLPHITNITRSEANYVATKYDIGKHQVQFASKSLFDYVDDLSKRSNFRSIMLNEHYRCHPDIIKWSNENIYKTTLGQIMTIKTSPEQYDISGKGFHWVDISGNMDNENNTNENQALATKKLYEQIRTNNPGKTIGIIAPFRKQINLLELKIGSNDKLLKIDTVHKFQGDEKDIIIFNTVVSSNSAKSKMDFINRKTYLLNVAITRAKGALYIIGDLNALSSNGTPRTALEKLASYSDQLSELKE